MVKIQTFIRINMEMSLDEARAVRQRLGAAAWGTEVIQDAYDALDAAIRKAEEVGK